jgi:hypothetical protein
VTPEGTLTGDQLQRLTSCLRTVALGCRVAPTSAAAVAGLRDPHFQHDPTGLPEVTPARRRDVKGTLPAAQVEEAAEPPYLGLEQVGRIIEGLVTENRHDRLDQRQA